jgi:hypothetical protein
MVKAIPYCAELSTGVYPSGREVNAMSDATLSTRRLRELKGYPTPVRHGEKPSPPSIVEVRRMAQELHTLRIRLRKVGRGKKSHDG